MKVNITEIFKDLSGIEIHILDKVENANFIDSIETPNQKPFTTKKIPITLRYCFINVLLNEHESDKNESCQKKLERYHFAMKCHEQDEIELTSEQVSMLKKRIAFFYSVIIVGRVCEILDPQAE